MPCALIGQLPADGGLVMGTAPAEGRDAALNAMLVTVSAGGQERSDPGSSSGRVDVIVRNVVVASVEIPGSRLFGDPHHLRPQRT